MRIATWNVNGLRARLDFVLHWLRARQPDVVGLQELKLANEEFPVAELEAAGYPTTLRVTARRAGMASRSYLARR
jgi:exodeoxyribonuclease-3